MVSAKTVMTSARTILKNDLQHEIRAQAHTSRKWLVADIGLSTALIITPIGAASESVALISDTASAWQAFQKIWAVVSAGREIATGVVSQLSDYGTSVSAGESAELHRVGPVGRFTRPSGIAGFFGADTVRIIIADEEGKRALAFSCSPGGDWVIDEDGAVGEDGERHPWILESSSLTG